MSRHPAHMVAIPVAILAGVWGFRQEPRSVVSIAGIVQGGLALFLAFVASQIGAPIVACLIGLAVLPSFVGRVHRTHRLLLPLGSALFLAGLVVLHVKIAWSALGLACFGIPIALLGVLSWLTRSTTRRA